jgi:hypothetical protein
MDHCALVTKIRERLSLSNRTTQKFDMERYNLRRVNEVKVSKEYQVKIRNRVCSCGDSANSMGIAMDFHFSVL